ncbi:MAG: GTPase domain-containing protein [Candidatus Methylomirabilia bacterium]
MATIDLSLISHTNIGKTTLARTLLRREVGEIRDGAHVTDAATAYTLIESPGGDTLRLWDTPGFGDSARLLRRLQQSNKPLGWFLTQVWDRYADRPFFSSQIAVRNVRDAAAVVLYLVNAAEDPAGCGYLDPEMKILDWTGKPVLVLLNQLGAPRPAAQERAEVERWATLLAGYPCVRGTLAFDAFARCWVQEHALLERIGAALPEAARETFARLEAAWRARNEAVFHSSVDLLATQLAALAGDGEEVATPTLKATARAWLAGIVRGERAGAGPGVETAMQALAGRADARIRQATDGLIALHGLSGSAAAQIRERVATDFVVDPAADTGKAGVIGAAVSGALGGLIADLHAGGLTFGAGALVGGLLGAAGARGLAQAYNLVRGTETSTVRWSNDVRSKLVAAAGLRYLAVAHFGRGRGDFVEGEHPSHWRSELETAIGAETAALTAIWSEADRGQVAGGLERPLREVIERVLRAVLAKLY